jgi:uncharacterized repeat protein (TIGR02059 family)
LKNAFIIIFLFISVAVNATIYYVKSTGNDAYSGLSDAQAWATIAKLNSRNFSAGDSILFKRGDIWETWITDNYLSVTSSGTPGNPIVYCAYGSGAKPIIRQIPSITGWNTSGNWTQSGNKWYMTVSPQPMRLWLSGIEKQVCGTTIVTSSLPWNWTSNVLYIYSATNPATTFSNIQCPGHGVIISGKNANYITLKNLNLQGGGLDIGVFGCNYWIIDSCNIGNGNGGDGVRAYASGVSNPSDYGVIKNCLFDTGDRFIDNFTVGGLSYQNSIDAISVAYGCNHWEIYYNTIKDWGHGAIWFENTNPSYTNTYNKAYNNYITAPDIDYMHGFGDLNIASTNNHNEIYSNLIYDTPAQNQFDDYGLKFYNNIINKVRGVAYRAEVGTGISLEGESSCSSKHMEFSNNVIANCSNFGFRMGVGGTNRQYNLIRNNIIFNCDAVYNYQILVNPDSANLDNTWQNNLFYKQGVTDLVNFKGSLYTVAGFNARNGTNSDVIQNNITGDPLFVNVANGDFHLQSNSPCINAGVDVGLTEDYEGNPIIGVPDIGAYEHSSIPTSPVIPIYQSSFIDTATTSLLEITYNVSLANIVPATSSFSVRVNSVVRTVNAVVISGTKVQLTLASPIVYGDVVTFSYTKPTSNPLQTPSGGIAASISNQTAINNCINIAPTVNQPPFVVISNPLKGDKYETNSTITIDAIASDPDGSIRKVEFYNGAVKLVELTSAPYTYTWKDVAAGSYLITAVATDNLNATTTSLPVEFEVWTTIKYDADSKIINLYPNPNDGHFSIGFINPLQNERSEILITDLAGKQVYNGYVSKEETIKQIDLSYIKSGIYILMIIYKEILVTKKIIIN